MVWSRAWSDVWHDLDGIAASITISIINYILLGLEFPVDGFYMHSFEIWLATTVVFYGSGNVGFTLLEYRLGKRGIFWALWENIAWIPFLYVPVTCFFSITSILSFSLASFSLADSLSLSHRPSSRTCSPTISPGEQQRKR